MFLRFHVIVLFFCLLCHHIFAASALPELVNATIPEERWRWHQNLTLQVRGAQIPFEEAHRQLTDLEFSASTKWKRSIEGSTHKMGNIALGAISIIYSEPSKPPQTMRVLIDDISSEHPTILFESSDESSLSTLGLIRDAVPTMTAKAREDMGGKRPALIEELLAQLSMEVGINPAELALRRAECKAVLAALETGPRLKIDDYHMLLNYLHSEQFLRIYISDPEYQASLIKQALAKIPPGSVIEGIILHIHSRLDMCERCSQTWAIELSKPESLFTQLRGFLRTQGVSKGITISPDYRPFIFATSRDTYTKRDSRYRRGLDAHDQNAPINFHSPIGFFQKPLMPSFIDTPAWVYASFAGAAAGGAGAGTSAPPSAGGYGGASSGGGGGKASTTSVAVSPSPAGRGSAPAAGGRGRGRGRGGHAPRGGGRGAGGAPGSSGASGAGK